MPIPRHSRAAADLPALPLQPGERKHQWVYRQIVSAIEGGLLRPGDTVPSTRVLAARWGTSRGVVELVFEQLNHEGYLHAMAGKGTRVNDPLPDSFLCAQMSNETSHELVDSSQGDFEPAHAGVTPNPVRAGQPFIARLPDVHGFEIKGWRNCISKAVRLLEPEVMGDTDPRGLFELREEICKHLAASRAIRCLPEHVIVVTGIRHAIDLIAHATLAQTPTPSEVALEDPGYAGAAAIFRLHGCVTVAVPVDENGIDVVQLGQTEASLVYVTPAHQAPTGVVMLPERREELLA